MWKTVLICSLLVVTEVFGNEPKKTESKYPKKYNPETLQDGKAKILDPIALSYTSFNASGPTDPIDLPPVFYKYFSVLQHPQGDLKTGDAPSEFIVPPPEDTYSTYEDRPFYSIIVPKSDLHLVKKYLGYTSIGNEEELIDPLTAPEVSSYSEMQPSEAQFLAGELSPPSANPPSSYVSYDTYASDSEPLRPPPPSE